MTTAHPIPADSDVLEPFAWIVENVQPRERPDDVPAAESVKVAARLSPSVLQAVDHLANRAHRSRNWMIQNLLFAAVWQVAKEMGEDGEVVQLLLSENVKVTGELD